MARALGRYELLRPLARGGMAEVYLARRRAAGVEKWLVVKRMRPERSGDPRFLDLFVREARLSMSLVHQNIVPVFDFGRIDEQVFLAMERVEGKDLGSSLSRAPTHRLPPLLAAFIAAECCQALDYAHQRKGPDGVALGVVHRDVTPRNVLLSWSGEVKLTDFGIAALAGESTSRLLGTPQYMAPEQARSEPIDPRADIYAVGMVLREALSGQRPRAGADRDAIVDAARRGSLLPWPHLAGPPDPPPDKLGLGSGDHGPREDEPREPPPAELVAIVERATAPAASDRYPDARTMLEDLDHYIVGQRARHKAESPARQLGAWLATVWDGARDDTEVESAIDAEHLVSFLDDGAFDVVGTGTVRSLAATAADESHRIALASPAPTGPASPSPAMAPPDAPATAAPAGERPPRAPSESGGRSTRISSSNTTVASGSFHTMRTLRSGADQPPDTRRWRRQRRSLPALATIVVVGIAGAGVAAMAFRDRGRHTQAGQLDTRQAGQPPTGQPDIGQPNTRAPNAGPPSTGQPDTGQPNAGQPNPGQPNAGPPSPGAPTADLTLARSSTARQPTEPHSASRPSDGGSVGPSGSVPRISGPPDSRASVKRSGAEEVPAEPAPDVSRGDAATGSDTVPPAVKPATCRVRINLTPWAFYTVDQDTTRYETPSTIDLTPGEHRLHVWNPELRVERDITIHVPADRDTMNFSEPLQPSTLSPDAAARKP